VRPPSDPINKVIDRRIESPTRYADWFALMVARINDHGPIGCLAGEESSLRTLAGTLRYFEKLKAAGEMGKLYDVANRLFVSLPELRVLIVKATARVRTARKFEPLRGRFLDARSAEYQRIRTEADYRDLNDIATRRLSHRRKP
jgi:hypothetical protein